MTDSLKKQIDVLEQNKSDLENKLAVALDQLAELDKFVLLGRLTAGIAHEINTPLGALRSNNDLFIRCLAKIRKMVLDESGQSPNETELKKLLETMDQLNAVNKTASQRIVNIVNGVRSYARQDVDKRLDIDLNALIADTLPLLQHEIKNRVEIHRNFAQIPPVGCNPNQISQVFLNILVNASQAITGKGDIFIDTFCENDTVIIDIRDTGKGIAPENQDQIFELGFTTKGIGAGMGLGLALVKQIVEAHCGSISVTSEPGKGATFRVVLPVHQPDC